MIRPDYSTDDRPLMLHKKGTGGYDGLMNTLEPSTSREASPATDRSKVDIRTLAGLMGLMLFVCLAFALANPSAMGEFDYQFRIASAFLSGQLGLDRSSFNEMVPFEGKYYSVFPLGSVLCMLPIALFQKLRGVSDFPAREVIAWIAGTMVLFVAMVTNRYRDPLARRTMLTFLALFGTFVWSNLAFGNGWQLAMGLAMLGEFGALAFTLQNRQPVLAGFCFAIAYGNRTEILLTAPLFLYLLLRPDPYRNETASPANLLDCLCSEWRSVVGFLAFPLILGIATLWYNFARFHNPFDFGYTRIPYVMNEPWYQWGLFSLHAIPLNVKAMVFDSSWESLSIWPFFKPAILGGSIISASPFLLLIFREGGRDRALRIVCWLAIGLLTLALWTHGNAGGVQFSYRYAMVLLPWMIVLLLDQRGGKVMPLEWGLFGLSILSNIWSVYGFFWLSGHP